MELDAGSALIGAIAVAICALPFFFMSLNKKKRERGRLQALTQLAAQKNGQLSQHELSPNYAIGMDQAHGMVFFRREFNEAVEEQAVDLAQVKSCKVVKSTRTLDRNQRVIDKLALALSPVVKENPEINLEFFSS